MTNTKIKKLKAEEKEANPSSGKTPIEKIFDDHGLQDDIKKLHEGIRLHRLHESNELKKSEEQGDFVPVHKTIKKDDFERTFLRFYHLSGNTYGEYINAIMSLEIPITEIKVDTDSAIKIAKKEGFGAEVIISFNDPNKKYLDIYMNIYVKSYMQTAIEKLKNIAREILKED